MIQGILPLRGKPPNSTNLNIDDVLKNQEMIDLISAIGLGTADHHNLSVKRYGKVIICADAD